MRASVLTAWLAAAMLAAGVFALVFIGPPGQAQSDQSVLARLVSRALSTPEAQVRIGAIEGALTSDATIRDLRVSDSEGVWLQMDRARLVWTRSALLRGRLQVDRLEIGRIEVMRRPAPSEAPPANATDEPLLPETPVKVVVDQFTLSELALHEPVLGSAARVSAKGRASLGDPAEGLVLDVEATRQDAPGSLAAVLRFAPQTKRLRVELSHSEPEGGLVARALELPGLPPVALRIAGDGPLSDFAASIDFAAGPTIGAQGAVRVTRTGDAYRVASDLDARVSGLAPGFVAPLLEGSTRLDGTIVVQDDGQIRMQDLRVASAAAALRLSGEIGADRMIDLRLRGEASPRPDADARIGAAEFAALSLDLAANGPLSSPIVTGTASARGVKTSLWSLESFDGKLDGEPLTKGASRYAFTASASAAGVRIEDAAQNSALGGRISLDARGTVQPSGAISIETAAVETPTASLTYAGMVAPRSVEGVLSLQAPELAPFSGLVSRRLRGAARLDAKISGDPRRRLKADLSGALTGLSVDGGPIDALLGDNVRLAGSLARTPGGAELEAIRLTGAGFELTANGVAREKEVALELRVNAADIGPLHPRIARGRIEARATVKGPAEAPRILASAILRDARAMDRSIDRLELTFDGLLGDAPQGLLQLAGDVGGKPASGGLRLAQTEAGAWDVEAAVLRIGSAQADGRVRIAADGLVQGAAKIVASNLDDLSPLALRRLEGRIDASVTFSSSDGEQDVEASAEAARLRIGDFRLQDLEADVRVRDAFGAARADGRVVADSLVVGGQSFSEIALIARSDAQGTAIDAKASATGFSLAATGRFEASSSTRRLALSRFEARRNGRTISLAAPASIEFRNGGLHVPQAAVRVGAGQITLRGGYGERVDLSMQARNVPFSAADIFAPALTMQGTLNGRLEAKGELSQPQGSYELAIEGFANAATRNAGLQPLSASARGDFSNGRVRVDGTIKSARLGQIRVKGDAPLALAGPVDLALSGRLNLQGTTASLAAAGQRLSGEADIDMRIVGDLKEPRPQGVITIAGATFDDAERGLRITNIDARIAARDGSLFIERASARTRNDGALSASGSIGVDPQAGWPADIMLVGRRAQLASNATTTAVADFDVAVRGPLMRTPEIAGRVEFLKLDVSLPDRLPDGVQPLPGARHIAPPPRVRARLAERRAATKARSGTVFNARLDLSIVAQSRVFVRGRGLEAELGGDMRLTGTIAEPAAQGAFDLRRGRLDLLSQRIALTRGRLDFAGDLIPHIDIVAETRAGDVTARIAIEGPANQPTFVMSSSPELPQDEVLSRILFQRAAGGLSPGQALQLAQAVAVLSGGGGAFESIRRSLGVDSLDIGASASGGATVGASRYISDRVRLGVRAGAKPEDNAVSVDIDLTRRFKLQSELNADGSTSVGAGVEWEW